MKLISIIIVTQNGSQWLPGCLKTLHQQKYKNIEIILVDNASTDHSVDWIYKHYPRVHVVLNKTNVGFAQGNNIGYQRAKGEYIVFLNNDTRVTPDFITELVRVMEKDSSIGGVQSKILLMDNPKRLDSIGAFLTPTGFLYHNKFGEIDKKEFDTQIDLYTAKGACMMFRRDVLEKVKVDGSIFDPDFFAYFEETDLCHRVWLSGYRIVYAPKSVIYHKMGATSSSMDSTFIQYHSFKNRIRSYLKNFGILWLITILPIHLFACQMYGIFCFIQGKFGLFQAIEQAFWWNIVQLPKTVHMRHYTQGNIRKVSDKEISLNIMKVLSIRYYLNMLFCLIAR